MHEDHWYMIRLEAAPPQVLVALLLAKQNTMLALDGSLHQIRLPLIVKWRACMGVIATRQS